MSVQQLAMDVLRGALRGEPLDDEKLNVLRRASNRESLVHDFKSGIDYREGSPNLAHARRELRRMVAGFANADGGVLIVGIEDSASDGDALRSVDGCSAVIGDKAIEDWASTVLRELAPYFDAQPIPRTYSVDGKTILVIAVPKAPSLVEVQERGERPVFPLRLGDGTHGLRGVDRVVNMSDSLVEDILTRRRSRPVFRLTPIVQDLSRAQQEFGEGYRFTVEFRVEQASMLSPCPVSIGAIGFSLEPPPRVVSEGLRDRIDAVEPRRLNWADWGLAHLLPPTSGAGASLHVAPLESATVHLGSLVLPTHRFVTCFAVYVLADEALPRWFEVEVAHPHQHMPYLTAENVTVRGLGVERPRVAVDWKLDTE